MPSTAAPHAAYLGDPTLADAICDRVLHHAHRLVLRGPSRRKENINPTAFYVVIDHDGDDDGARSRTRNFVRSKRSESGVDNVQWAVLETYSKEYCEPARTDLPKASGMFLLLRVLFVLPTDYPRKDADMFTTWSYPAGDEASDPKGLSHAHPGRDRSAGDQESSVKARGAILLPLNPPATGGLRVHEQSNGEKP